jgi:uncharacterized membrane protein
MIEMVDRISDIIATAIEVVMVAVIVVGSLRAIAAISSRMASRQALAPAVREIWLHYAAWILLALEFALAADIIRTVALEPTLENALVLGIIVLVRTLLSFTLSVEIEGRWPWQQPATGTLDGPRLD